jgi:hypothetical protein
MNTSSAYRSFAFLLLTASFFSSCSGDTKNAPGQQEAAAEMTSPSPPQPPSINASDLSVETFEVKDSTSGKSLGWGYDIIFSGGGKVHQPTIPAIQGIKYFSSEADAKKTGDFAAEKIKRYGGLTGLTTRELDSLGVTQ